MDRIENILREFKTQIEQVPDIIYSLDKVVNLLKLRVYGRQEIQHMMEVCRFSRELIKKQKITDSLQIKAILIGAILHDVGRYLEDQEIKHHTAITETDLLDFLSVKDEEARKVIVRCIQRHSRKSKEKPETIEEKILFDADHLTLFTEFGFKRWFFKAEAWGHVYNVQDADDQLEKLYYEAKQGKLFYLEDSRQILSESFYTTLYRH